MKMYKKFRKGLAILAITGMLLGTYAPAYVYAAPSLPSAPSKPSTPDQPEQPDKPATPTKPGDQPDKPLLPGQTPTPIPVQSPLPTPAPEGNASSTDSSNTVSASPTSVPQTTSTGGEREGDSSGETTIETGDANAVGSTSTSVNTNIASGTGGTSGSGTTISNDGNGTNSTSSVNAKENNSTEINQNNSAVISNDANIQAKSGGNTIRDNTGGDVTIKTGDANVSGTFINQANTNIAATDVVEFNVIDDHVGDIVMDFNNPCTTGGCIASAGTNLSNQNNGTNSNNDINYNSTNENATFQNNDATVENNIILAADSGRNRELDNTMGDASIETGNANVSASVVNFINNNFSGNVLVGVVNIFGDLVGDILLPADQVASGNQNGTNISNSGNGVDSENTINFDNVDTDYLAQTNTANIDNNINLEATTGQNKLMDNTNSNSNIQTGEASVDANVINIANNNVSGGDWWIVLINEAGQWFGKIMGAPEGVNLAGSEGTVFDQNGDIINASNGSNTQNDIAYNSNDSNTTEQTNNANIVNNLDLSANTGKNTIKDNTMGDASISTGDANIMVNLVNFVNNNFSGGNVYVSVINVFGSWTGNFFGPGQTKDKAPDSNNQEENNNPAVGGYTADSSNLNNSSSSNSFTSTSEVKSVVAEYDEIMTPAPNRRFLEADTVNAEEDNQEVAMVQGASDFQNKDNRLNINLAWAILAAPAVALFITARKGFLMVKSRRSQNAK